MKHLKLWETPECYMGNDFPDHYVFLGQSRDSDALTESNFIKGLEEIGGETDDDEQVFVHRSSHFLCGWVECILIHKTASAALAKAEDISERMEDYPVVDEEHWCNLEHEKAESIWKDLTPKDRLEHCRLPHVEIDYPDYPTLLRSIRTGHYYLGNASDLLD